MILNHQNLPVNHQILQVTLQAAEQHLLRTIYFADSSCSQSYLILECFHQNSFSYVIDCHFSHRETSCTVCRSCHPCCVVWTPVSAVCSTMIFLFLKPKTRFLLQSLTQHISWNGYRLITAVKCHKHLLKLSPWWIQPVGYHCCNAESTSSQLIAGLEGDNN